MSALHDYFVGWASANSSPPTRPGASWNQLCALGMFSLWAYAGGRGWAKAPSVTGPNAKTVGQHSGALNTNYGAAPIGAFHFWSIAGDGHVGIDLDGGGSAVGMMGTAKLAQTIHPYIGIQSVSGYGTSTYMGWSTNYGGGVPNLPSEVISGTQRRVLSSAPANRRGDPSTNNAVVGDPLAPGSVGNFVGWIHGQNVSGNDVWFKGTSGNWFWSGGFEGGPNTAGLTDLNVTVMVGNQRQALAVESVNARADANTSATIDASHSVAAGAVGTFDGWKHGESVTANGVTTDVWFHGAISGNWFWAGGFTDIGTHDLKDMNPVVTPPDNGGSTTPNTNRTAGNLSVNVRDKATTAGSVVASLAADTTVPVLGFQHGLNLSGNDIWFHIAQGYAWSGGFTSQDVTGLTEEASDPGSTTPPPPPYKVAGSGLDISGYQTNIDLAAAKAAGVEWVIVKAGGHNVSTRYISTTDYPKLVDAARAAGLYVGHYWVIGKGDVEDDAAYFVANLHNFDVNADVLMIDNETLDANGTTYSPADAAKWIEKVVALTGIDRKRVWHYAGGATYKSGVDWSPVTATGCRYVYAAYGGAPYSTTLVPSASSNPEPNGSIPDWDVHQYSSSVQIGGVTADGEASRITAAELFAKGTVTVVTPPDDGGTTTPPDNGGGSVNPDPNGTLSEQVAALEALVVSLQSEKASLQGQVTSLNTQVSTLATQVEALTGQNSTLTTENSKLTTGVRAAKDALNDLL